jgi:group II intron reverse transcriptase/maturase
MTIKLTFEPKVEKIFLPDSYGYRPNKSALDAVGITRTRCRKQDWVLEFDIKGLFDNIPHDLLMRAVNQHTKCKWTKLYIKRWLIAPMQDSNGNITQRSKGTPQGGVISPILANLFLHYVFDKWITKNHPNNNWCRYADDGLVHTKTKEEAELILKQLNQRFNECGLQIHPTKTKIVYCQD